MREGVRGIGKRREGVRRERVKENDYWKSAAGEKEKSLGGKG